MDVQQSPDAEARTTPPVAPGGLPFLGHLLPFYRNPVAFLLRTWRTLGDVFTIRLLGRSYVVVLGPQASQAVFRADDHVLGRRRAYRSMTPVFGKGMLFDAGPERFNEQVAFLRPALQSKAVTEFVEAIVDEVSDYLSGWGDHGEVDLVDAMSELAIIVTTRCLIGPDFRRRVGDDLAPLVADLKSGGRLAWLTSPYLPLPPFRRRDRARRKLITLIGETVRTAQADLNFAQANPLLHTIASSTYADGTPISPDETASLLLAFVVAGEHNTAALASWVGALILQDPARLARVRAEQTASAGARERLTAGDLHAMTQLKICITEAERLYPPTTVLLRDAEQDFDLGGFRVPAGGLIMPGVAASHRLPHLFADPETYDPDRFLPPRAEHEATPNALMAFGGGKHRCTGMAFAYQEIQIIWSLLLRTFELELVDGPARPDYTAVVAVPQKPCRLRYRRR